MVIFKVVKKSTLVYYPFALKILLKMPFCNEANQEALPGGVGGIPCCPSEFKTSHVGVLKNNACCLLSALLSLSQFG